MRIASTIAARGWRERGWSSTLLADAALLLVALIWGSTFVMVKEAVASYPVFWFLALRFAFAVLALLPLVWIRARGRPRENHAIPSAARKRPRMIAPVLIGTALFAGYGFQTSGLQMTTPAKAGFVTGLSVVIVPVVAAVLLRQPPGRNAWIGVGLATGGLGLLTLQSGFRIDLGDLLVFLCALAFAAHILLTGRFSPRIDSLLLTFGQIVTVTVLCGVMALATESPQPLTGNVLFAAAFTGVFATSAAFGIQTLAQKSTTATHTALVLSMEPVFAALFSYLLIGELLGPRQLVGCGLILAGMLVAEAKRTPRS